MGMPDMRDWEESKPRAQNSEASNPVVPMAMDADRDDGAGSVVYDIPRSFKALSLRPMNSSDESLLNDIQTYCMQLLRLPSQFQKIQRSIQVDGHLKRGVLSWSALAFKVVRGTLAHTGNTAGFGYQARRSE